MTWFTCHKGANLRLRWATSVTRRHLCLQLTCSTPLTSSSPLVNHISPWHTSVSCRHIMCLQWPHMCSCPLTLPLWMQTSPADCCLWECKEQFHTFSNRRQVHLSKLSSIYSILTTEQPQSVFRSVTRCQHIFTVLRLKAQWQLQMFICEFTFFVYIHS